MANQIWLEPVQKELFEIKDLDVVWLPRAYAWTLILEKRPGKQECSGKPKIQSNNQQFVWLEELLTMSQFKKSLMNALQLTMTYIENRGFSPWQLLLGKTPTDKTAYEDPDLAQCSVEVVDEAAKQCVRVKEESYKASIEEELSLRNRRKRGSSSPTMETLGSK